jgi:hypothetical protein
MTQALVRAWANAYLAQARADLDGARAVQGQELSVFAMLLQMVFEKLAKAALLRTGAVTLSWAQGSHKAASRMVRVLRLQRGLLDPLGGAKVWGDVLWVVEALENAHPQVAGDTPQLEYPWQTSAGVVQWPARHLPIAMSLEGILAVRVLKFASLLSLRFDQIFP